MAKNRLLQSVRDMVLSLGLVLGVVALVVLVTWRDQPDDPVRVVDTAPVKVGAVANAPYAVVVPRGLEPQWRPTSARVSSPGADPFRWHIGYVTPSSEYAAVGQSDGPAASYLDNENAGGERNGSVRIKGTNWMIYEREDGERTSLVRTADGVTTLVTGTGTLDELSVLASSLGRYVAEPTPSGAPTPSLTPI